MFAAEAKAGAGLDEGGDVGGGGAGIASQGDKLYCEVSVRCSSRDDLTCG